jgi:hypothetical protein
MRLSSTLPPPAGSDSSTGASALGNILPQPAEHVQSAQTLSLPIAAHNNMDKLDEEGIVQPRRAPIWQCMIAGGLGGSSGDLLMHSLDTVKTRQQGDPHFPPRYAHMSSSYYKIFREEGFRRGLYGGITPALLGSFPATVIFFGIYEVSKRSMLDYGINEHVAFLTAGKISISSQSLTVRLRGRSCFFGGVRSV